MARHGRKFKDTCRERIRQAFAWWGGFDYLGETSPKSGVDVYYNSNGLTFYVAKNRAYAANGGFGNMNTDPWDCTSALLENVQTAHELQAMTI